MPNLGFLKRLIKEDFKKDEYELIGKVGGILNPALEAITGALNKGGLNVSDLNAQLKDVEVIVDVNGLPRTDTTFASELKGLCSGLMVVQAQNLTNPTIYPTTAPFISFTQDKGQIIINHVSGLQDGDKYKLKIFAIV